MATNERFWNELRAQEGRAADAHDARANPYYSAYAWWWTDENGKEYGPYESQSEALQTLLQALKERDKWQHQRDGSKGKSTPR